MPALNRLSLIRQEDIRMKYVDGFVVAVPAANKEAYHRLAAAAAPLFKEFVPRASWSAGAMMCPTANLPTFASQ